VVRRCYLLGDDPVSGKNYDHRKVMIENQLQRLAGAFGIDLLGFAIMSNHFHLILRSRPDVVLNWDDSEVARRWLLICPVRKNSAGDPEEPNEFELNSIRNDPRKLETIRLRLSDLGWWMRVLCQYIAVRANREDNQLGKFWQSRFRAVRLLDEAALLACEAYVDLNPIRAAMAETLEQSDYTSVQRRIQSFSPTNDNSTSATSATSQPKQECTDNLSDVRHCLSQSGQAVACRLKVNRGAVVVSLTVVASTDTGSLVSVRRQLSIRFNDNENPRRSRREFRDTWGRAKRKEAQHLVCR